MLEDAVQAARALSQLPFIQEFGPGMEEAVQVEEPVSGLLLTFNQNFLEGVLSGSNMFPAALASILNRAGRQ